MKKYILILGIIISALACTEAFNEQINKELTAVLSPRYLDVSPQTLTFGFKSSEPQCFDVTSEKTAWQIENSIDWITLSALSGEQSSSVDVDVEDNTALENPRTGIFFVKCATDDWHYESTFSVIQDGAAPYINLSEDKFSFSGALNTVSIGVDSNCNWELKCEDDWIQAVKNGDNIDITVSSNPYTYQYRTSTIDVVYNGEVKISEQITIYQAGTNITTSESAINFGCNAAQATITIESEVAWSAHTDNSWIDLDKSCDEAGTSALTVSVSPNTTTSQRVGHLTIEISEFDKLSIAIYQDGLYLEVDSTREKITAEGGIIDLAISSNTSWSIEELPSWLTVDKSSGDGDYTLEVTAAENTTTDYRSHILTIAQSGTELSASVEITQGNKYINIDATQLVFEDFTSSQTVEVNTNGEWEATTKNDWITLTPNDNLLEISVSENTAENERIGLITVEMLDKIITIQVTQKGKFFTLSHNDLSYGSKGGQIDITISTTDSWLASIKDDLQWLSLSSNEGKGKTTISVYATDNPSVNSREGIITLTSDYHQDLQVRVKQNARYLTLNTNHIILYAKGGESDLVTVNTDGEFSVSSSDNWFQIVETENNFNIIATENTNEIPRKGIITIALTDLVEGSYAIELPVTQFNSGFSFLRDDFGDDNNWDTSTSTDANIELGNFGDESSWDNPNNSSATITLTSYTTDSNWDSNSISSLEVVIDGFKEDANLDNNTTTSGDITQTDYDDDTSLDNNTSSSGEITQTDYDDETNLDNNTSSSGNITQTDYGDDTNLDNNTSSSGEITTATFGDDKNWNEE